MIHRSATRHSSSGHTLGVHARFFGFTLIEMMIALLLGAIVIGGVVSVFLATQQTYRTNQALGDVQDGARIAFDLMSRDIREAGLTGCYSNSGSVANVLNNGPNGSGAQLWWANWNNVIHGYNAGDPGLLLLLPGVTQASGGANQTQSIELIGASDTSVSVATHNPATSTFTLNETTSSLQKGDIIVVCDPNHAVITQITSNITGTPLSFTDTVAGGLTPGNCSAGLAFPTVCTAAGTSYTFGANSPIAKLSAVNWFVGNSAYSTVGTSLYRADLETQLGVPQMVAQEMVTNVTGLQFTYHQASNTTFVDASKINNWSAVDSVQVTLTLQSSNQRASTTQTAITRTFTSTSTLRNRMN